MVGTEFQTDDNSGPGKTYDLLKPPNGKTSSRPRSFDDTPGTVQFSVFAEDRITGEWLIPFTFDIGFRIDAYNPTGFHFDNLFNGKDIFASDQGTFFNPRLGLKLRVAPKTQLRLTYSKTSKAPPISAVYPEPFFIDVYDLTYKIENDSVKYVDLVSTYAYNRANLKLKGYQSTKYEVSLDQQFGDIGVSLTAYYQTTTGSNKSIDIPYTFNRYFWLDWPDTTNKLILESVTTHDGKYSLDQNLGKSVSSGFEFNLTSHRIPSLNMIFRVNGSFNFVKYSSKFYRNYGSTFTFSPGDTLPSGVVADEETQIIPYYEPSSTWSQRTVINYFVDYIAKPLGIWLTFKAQQVLWTQDLDILNPKPTAVGYYMNGENYNIDPRTSDRVGFTKIYDRLSVSTDKSKPNNQWLFSIVASKSLYRGAEVSLFVENIFNDRAYYVNRSGLYSARNFEIFWGISFSSKLDDLFR